MADLEAQSGGVPIGGIYHTSGTICVINGMIVSIT